MPAQREEIGSLELCLNVVWSGLKLLIASSLATGSNASDRAPRGVAGRTATHRSARPRGDLRSLLPPPGAPPKRRDRDRDRELRRFLRGRARPRDLL